MNISFIGSGNVATHLALAFYRRGHRIDQIWSRDIGHAQLLASRVEAIPIDDISHLATSANVYILAISDNALFDLALDLRLGDALVLHTSGATSMEVLKHTSKHYGVVWSPQTFVRDVALEYETLPFCIEGCTPKTEDQIAELVSSVSTQVFRINHRQRQYLHLSAVFVNNFVNGLYGMAQEICRQQEIPFEVLYPLISTTAQHIKWGDVRYQITGPAVRNDTKTINAHRRLIANMPEELAVYDQLTKYIQDHLKF